MGSGMKVGVKMNTRRKKNKKKEHNMKSKTMEESDIMGDALINDDMQEEEADYVDITPGGLDQNVLEEEDDEMNDILGGKKHFSESKEHKRQLESLKFKDPEFFEFLKDHDQELLQFSDEDNVDIEDGQSDKEIIEDGEAENIDDMDSKMSSKKVLTTAMVDSWCQAAKEHKSLGAIKSLMKVFRTACHHGDGDGDDSASNLSLMTSNVFNKIMLFVLNEIDGLFRNLLELPSSGGNRDSILNLKETRQWKKVGFLIKTYLGNALHILDQMTDKLMISFTLRRLKASTIFLAAYPSLLRRYLKVALHFWGTAEGALSVISFLFIRDMAIRLGSECIDACMKGIYKTYVQNCKFFNSSRLQHIHFLGNCVVELYGVDLSAAYQHSFVFIRQLAMGLRNGMTMKTKESFRQVYNWKFMSCLDLWVKLVCKYPGPDDMLPLAFPIAQIVSGVARLVPSARYFPLRLHCVKMLNRIASATKTFIPVTSFLVDMLEFKELHKPPTGGLGTAVDFMATLKVPKQFLKTRSFQEECVCSVIEQLTEHLVLWSYSVAFPELAFVPLVRLRQFNKRTKVDRFRHNVKLLIDQIVSNVAYVGTRRSEVSFSPRDAVHVESFLQAEKEANQSPLSKYNATLRQKAAQRRVAHHGSSVEVADDTDLGKDPAVPSNERDIDSDPDEGAHVFSTDWLPENKSNKKDASDSKEDADEDIVENLQVSSGEDDEDDYEDDDDDENIIRNYENDKKGSKAHHRHADSQGKRKRKSKQKFSKVQKKSANSKISGRVNHQHKKQKTC